MDENYLDNLLNEISLDKEIDHKIEEELDNQIENEKRQYQEQQLISDEDLFNMDLELDANDLQVDQELHFSEAQIDELDHLDDLADLDIGDLDFSDIDFEDLDVTKLDDVESDDLDDLLKDFENDIDVANLFDTMPEDKKDNSELDETETSEEVSQNETEDELFSEQADLNEDSFDTDSFLDSLLEEEGLPEEIVQESIPDIPEETKESKMPSDEVPEEDEIDLLQALEEFEGGEDSFGESRQEEEPVSTLSDAENDDLDDILSMLDLDDASDDTSSTQDEVSIDSAPSSEAIEDMLDDLDELPASKPDKKQQLMEILFGEPDEDDILSEEELAEIEAKKAAKKEKKKAAKKAKEEKAKAAKEEKTAKNSQKQKDNQEKKKLKAQKKARRKAEELANAEPEKKLNKPMVIFIFTLFLGITFLFFLATNNFNYSQAIERATNYFANQKYRKAYDEIVGVEVKEEDEDLKNRIYTVMYVERLYESYLNNVELGRSEKALDSLLRGVDKYYEHYEEAKELGVTTDMDFSFNQISTVLNEQYGITVEQAVEINKLGNYEYVQFIQVTAGENSNIMKEKSDDTSSTASDNPDVNLDDATLPKEQEEEVKE